MMTERYSHTIINNVPEQKKYDYTGWLNLSSNELLSPTIQRLYNDFSKNQDYEIYRYPFYQKATNLLAELYGLNTDQIVLTAGSNNAIFLMLHCFGISINKIILEHPNYESYIQYAALNHIKVLTVNFEERSQFIDIVKGEKNCIVEITCPHGWSGNIIDQRTMSETADICMKNNHILLIDEAYGVFAEIDHTDLLKKYDNVFILRSMSKSFGIASLRIGCVISSKENISYFKRWYPSNSISQYACDFLSYCISNYDDIKNVQKKVIQNRELLKSYLSEINQNWVVWDTLSNFIVIQFGDNDEYTLFMKIMNNQKIKVKELSPVRGYQYCIRMTINEEIDPNFKNAIKIFIEGKQ